MSPELQTFLLAMSPVSELRLSIPVALTVWNLTPFIAWFWSVLGNAVPPAVLLLILDPLTRFLAKHFVFIKRCLNWWFDHVRRKFQKNYLRWGMAALVLFVAIPFPMTGAWSGATAAYLFGIPPKPAFFLILLGIMIAGVIVTGVTMGVFSIL